MDLVRIRIRILARNRALVLSTGFTFKYYNICDHQANTFRSVTSFITLVARKVSTWTKNLSESNYRPTDNVLLSGDFQRLVEF